MKGFHSITLLLRDVAATANVLTNIFGYKLTGEEGNRYRYTTDTVANAAIVDLLEAPYDNPVNAGGTIHHVAFRVKDEAALMDFREKIVKQGFNITQKIVCYYFFSHYFRVPGGVLFEIATDNPGFAIDEPADELGTTFKLPPQYESKREDIERALPLLV